MGKGKSGKGWFANHPLMPHENGVASGGGQPNVSPIAKAFPVATAPSKSQARGSLAYKHAMAAKHKGK